MRLATNEKNYYKYVMKFNFRNNAKLSKNLIYVEMSKIRSR